MKSLFYGIIPFLERDIALLLTLLLLHKFVLLLSILLLRYISTICVGTRYILWTQFRLQCCLHKTMDCVAVLEVYTNQVALSTPTISECAFGSSTSGSFAFYTWTFNRQPDYCLFNMDPESAWTEPCDMSHPWPYLKDMFEFKGPKNDSWRFQCVSCLPQKKELLPFNNSPSNLK